LADIKTISAMRCYGVAVITSLTVQNTIGVYGAYHQTPEAVGRQMDALLDDFNVVAVKTGMLPSVEVVREVARRLRLSTGLPLIVDPVVRSSTGFDLAASGIEAIVRELFPLAALVTPNVAEAEIIAGVRVNDRASMRASAARILEMGPAAVLVKGGDLGCEKASDVFVDRTGMTELIGPRIRSTNTHGTGCTLASAIASLLARGV